MMPDGIDAALYAARRLRRIDAQRARKQASSDRRRQIALDREEHPSIPHFCKGKHKLRPMGYLRGSVPDGVDCEKPLRVVCDDCDWVGVWACSNHRESKCRPCAARYRRRVRALAVHGMSKPGGHHYFVTFTAPSDEHRMPSGDVCPCSIEGFDVARWNATHSKRWNHLLLLLNRAYPDLEFFRGVEPQKRGALHDHVLVWSPHVMSIQTLRKLAITAGFGHEVLAPEIRPGSTQAAYYVSKYVTKACDARDDIPWWGDVVDFLTGELTEGLIRAPYRTWSQSQGWGTTMAAVRAESAVWAQMYADRALDPLKELLRSALGAVSITVPDPDTPLPIGS